MIKQIFSIFVILSISKSFSMEQSSIIPELNKELNQEISNISTKDVTILNTVDLKSGEQFISIFKLPVEIINKIVLENLLDFNNQDKIEIYKNYKKLALTCKFFAQLARLVTLKILLLDPDFQKILDLNKITQLNRLKELLTTDQSKNYFKEIISTAALKSTFLKSDIILKKLDPDFINKIYKMGENLREEKINIPTPLGYKETPVSNLHFAAYSGDVKLVKLFLEAQCNQNTRIYSQFVSVHALTPLIFLIKSIKEETPEHIEIVKLLLKYKATSLKLAEDFADRRNLKEIKKLILEQCSADQSHSNNIQENNLGCDLI